MPETTMMIPMKQSLCVDLIRYSDGHFTPECIGDLAEEQILSLLETTFDDLADRWFGERAFEFAEEYFPDIAEDWRNRDSEAAKKHQTETKPLVWKEVTVPSGSGVRMNYGGSACFAKVKNGRIVDDTGSYSPSEWAAKVAGGTSRNAWRDLWFKEPHARNWVPAQLMREQARSELGARIDIDL